MEYCEYGTRPLSAEEVIVHDGYDVLVEVDNNSALIVGDPRGILGQHLRPHPIKWNSSL
jgi:hypothetical protein